MRNRFIDEMERRLEEYEERETEKQYAYEDGVTHGITETTERISAELEKIGIILDYDANDNGYTILIDTKEHDRRVENEYRRGLMRNE